MLVVAVGEGRRHRFLPAADVAVVPALLYRRGADHGGPAGVGHAGRNHAPGGLGRGRAQLSRPDRAEDAQQRKRFWRAAFLGGGHYRGGEHGHDLGCPRRVRCQRADHVGAPQFRVDRSVDMREHVLRLAKHHAECLRGVDRREQLSDIGLVHPGIFTRLFARDAMNVAFGRPRRTPLPRYRAKQPARWSFTRPQACIVAYAVTGPVKTKPCLRSSADSAFEAGVCDGRSESVRGAGRVGPRRRSPTPGR